MSSLFNLAFLVLAAGAMFAAHRRRSYRPLWLLLPVVLIATAYNAVTPLAVRRVNLDFVEQVARDAPELEGYSFDASNMVQVPVVPISFTQPDDYDTVHEIETPHPWHTITEFNVILLFLSNGSNIVSVSILMDRSDSFYFSRIRLGPDFVGTPDYMLESLVKGDLHD